MYQYDLKENTKSNIAISPNYFVWVVKFCLEIGITKAWDAEGESVSASQRLGKKSNSAVF